MGPVWVTRCQMAPFSYSALRRALPKRTIRERERERERFSSVVEFVSAPVGCVLMAIV